MQHKIKCYLTELDDSAHQKRRVESIKLYQVIQGTDESGEVIAGTLLNAQCRVSFVYTDWQNETPLLWLVYLMYTRL